MTTTDGQAQSSRWGERREASWWQRREVVRVRGLGSNWAAAPRDVDAAQFAAWTMAARVLLNLDEFITRE